MSKDYQLCSVVVSVFIVIYFPIFFKEIISKKKLLILRVYKEIPVGSTVDEVVLLNK